MRNHKIMLMMIVLFVVPIVCAIDLDVLFNDHGNIITWASNSSCNESFPIHVSESNITSSFFSTCLNKSISITIPHMLGSYYITEKENISEFFIVPANFSGAVASPVGVLWLDVNYSSIQPQLLSISGDYPIVNASIYLSNASKIPIPYSIEPDGIGNYTGNITIVSAYFNTTKRVPFSIAFEDTEPPEIMEITTTPNPTANSIFHVYVNAWDNHGISNVTLKNTATNTTYQMSKIDGHYEVAVQEMEFGLANYLVTACDFTSCSSKNFSTIISPAENVNVGSMIIRELPSGREFTMRVAKTEGFYPIKLTLINKTFVQGNQTLQYGAILYKIGDSFTPLVLNETHTIYSNEIVLKVMSSEKGRLLGKILVEYPSYVNQIGNISRIDVVFENKTLVDDFNITFATTIAECKLVRDPELVEDKYECKTTYPASIDISKVGILFTKNEIDALNQLSDMKIAEAKKRMNDAIFYRNVAFVVAGLSILFAVVMWLWKTGHIWMFGS